ncbi:MAG: DUF6250 domain-containing protein [Cephaloticoccus sp.]|nr:DUF6250 domain-containing protein [Cephaloticoccus sp.]
MVFFLAGSLLAMEPNAQSDAVIHSDDFRSGLTSWVVEQQPRGTVTAQDGQLVIDDAGGCTVWFRPQLQAPVAISYDVRMSSRSRVSDLNCFWMASDPARPDDLLAGGHARDGSFPTYDHLRTYYVGYGGHTNTKTRFRRYDGTGARPLLPEHDLSAAEYLLQPDHVYHITLIAAADGRVQFIRDGEVVIDFMDPAPLKSGWFGFRTVHSRMEVTNFRVSAFDKVRAGRPKS